ncbi:class I SAM-dependent methyltransferase [bacterium]|nr:class I SAM-dependent methyltransferase [bacterium]
MSELDELFIKYNTDKSSLRNNYTHMYEMLFKGMKNDVKKVLEIGVACGGSVKSWRDYFPNATIYGMDINPNCVSFNEERIKVTIGDATDKEVVKKFIAENGSDFDIIIDDGSHFMTHYVKSFDLLFEHVKSEGLYVFEDLGVCYDVPCFKPFKDSKDFVFTDYLKDLVDDMNMHSLSYLTDFGDFSKYAKKDKSKDIKYMSFGNHIAFIHKK